MSEYEKKLAARLESHPVEMIGTAQQCCHMAFAACRALGLEYDETSPSDIEEGIYRLRQQTVLLEAGLRDQFAGQALAGIATVGERFDSMGRAAAIAYDLADAMLAEKQKRASRA